MWLSERWGLVPPVNKKRSDNSPQRCCQLIRKSSTASCEQVFLHSHTAPGVSQQLRLLLRFSLLYHVFASDEHVQLIPILRHENCLNSLSERLKTWDWQIMTLLNCYRKSEITAACVQIQETRSSVTVDSESFLSNLNQTFILSGKYLSLALLASYRTASGSICC